MVSHLAATCWQGCRLKNAVLLDRSGRRAIYRYLPAWHIKLSAHQSGGSKAFRCHILAPHRQECARAAFIHLEIRHWVW